ncbi:uncharacterized protein LOC109720836 [Ananas comosus]|uniref:Uncharacterized protein LOC109720836 n=1 Tax=Ananas comosus TaxID=4615 RepID=A0A6P5GCY7_ANACO|nr:uncharacterized protein LOC109720836 [Ananas comosus]
MAPSLFTLSPTTPIASPPPLPHLRPHPPLPSSLSLSGAGVGGGGGRRRRRAAEVVRPRAGGPSTNSLILAFVLPLSLLAGTIFTAARVADQLDEKYLNELAMNKAIMEENEAAAEEDGYDDDNDDEEEEGNAVVSPEKEERVVALPRARNRPIREV